MDDTCDVINLSFTQRTDCEIGNENLLPSYVSQSIGKAALAHCIPLCSVGQGRKLVRAGVDLLAIGATICLFFELLNVKQFHNPNRHVLGTDGVL